MKIGILISGRGSNMAAIIDAVKSGEIPDSEVAVVISDRSEAAGIAKAKSAAVETIIIERGGRSREDHDAEIIHELNNRGVDLVCLAGYMRLLSPSFVTVFPNRILNIHPSLLPAYPGLNTHERVLAAGEKFSGCTVHLVDEHLDHGPIIVQQWVPVESGDTVDSLSERILNLEHRLYVQAVGYLAEEFAVAKGVKSPRYKVLKSLAHNFSHSFVSLMNYVDDGYVIDDLRELVRKNADHRITIDWIPGEQMSKEFNGRIREGIKAYRASLFRSIYQAGAVVSSIKEFRTDIYLQRTYQMAVEGVLVDDRGRKYTATVSDF